MKRISSLFLALVLALALAMPMALPVAADPAPVLNPANGHYYELINTPVPWLTARDAAEAHSYNGVPGHLATITSPAEDAFVASTFVTPPTGPDVWLGGLQPLGSTEPAGGWQWVTFEPFSYANWYGGGPNNQGGNEDCLEMSHTFGGQWNDLNGAANNRAYIIEYDNWANDFPTWAAWVAAVDGDYIIEDFNDATLNPGLSVVTDNGLILSNGFWWDALTYPVGTLTTWTFAVPIYAFGGIWDLGSTWTDGIGHIIGGPGSNIEVLVNGSWVSVGVIDRAVVNEFWGFVSEVPFTQVRLQAYNDEGFVERYRLDNMVYSALPQYLTGGGQIVTSGEAKRKAQNVVSFAGNLGYTGDLTLMGQYQFNFHNVSVNDLDGAVFHSTSVSELVFYQDTNDGPAPPEAQANVAYFIIDGRLKMKDGEFEDGYYIAAMVADRGEPGVNDSINFALWQGATNLYSSTWDFPSNAAIMNGTTVGTKLTAGNLQIHADYFEIIDG